MVIFRENTEDIYAGIEYAGGTPEAQKILDFLAKEFPKDFEKIRFGTKAKAAEFWKAVGATDLPTTCRSASASSRSAIRQRAADPQRHRLRHRRQAQERDPGAQGQHHEVHRRRLPRLGLRDWRRQYFGAVEIDGGPWCKIPEGKPGAGIVIKDAIADITLQQVLTRPEDFDVIATLNLNGDYLCDALAAQVGGIGIAPGGNINYITGHAIFEATHGTAPKYANQDMVNPGSA